MKAEQQKKTFHIDEEKFAKLLNQSVNIFFEGERNIEVHLKIESAVAHYFKQREYFPEQKIIKEDKNGNLTLMTKISKSEEILMIIFHWIPYVKVLTPKELNIAVKYKIKAYLDDI